MQVANFKPRANLRVSIATAILPRRPTRNLHEITRKFNGFRAMLFFRDFSCGFRVPSTCRDPQGEMMCLRSAKIAATNDRCPSCPTEIFSFAFLPSSPAIKPFQPLARFFLGNGERESGRTVVWERGMVRERSSTPDEFFRTLRQTIFL